MKYQLTPITKTCARSQFHVVAWPCTIAVSVDGFGTYADTNETVLLVPHSV